MTYAQLKEAPKSILVFPQSVDGLSDLVVGRIQVRGVSFCLELDIESSGGTFLEQLLLDEGNPSSLSVSPFADTAI